MLYSCTNMTTVGVKGLKCIQKCCSSDFTPGVEGYSLCPSLYIPFPSGLRRHQSTDISVTVSSHALSSDSRVIFRRLAKSNVRDAFRAAANVRCIMIRATDGGDVQCIFHASRAL